MSYWQDAPMPRNQLVLIPSALETLLADDHPVRMVDEILDQLDWTDWESRYHGSVGKPPIHPSVMAKTLLFAMLRRIRSSRQIEYEVKHSIDFIWLTSGRKIDPDSRILPNKEGGYAANYTPLCLPVPSPSLSG